MKEEGNKLKKESTIGDNIKMRRKVGGGQGRPTKDSKRV